MTAGRVVRPVDAAGLILLRGRGNALEILLGRRHSKTAFLPDIYVVPGGRVDPCDHLPSGFRERLHPAVAKALGNGRRPPVAFLRAALRELHEETGLVLPGRRHGQTRPSSGLAGLRAGRGRAGFRRLRLCAAGHHAGRIASTLQHALFSRRWRGRDWRPARRRRAARPALAEGGRAGPAQHRRRDLGADPPCAGALAGPRTGRRRTG